MSQVFTFASLSAWRCADIELGWSATPARLVACGSDESEHDRLGSAMRVSGAMAELADEERDESDLCACEDMMCKVMQGSFGCRAFRREGRQYRKYKSR